MGNVESKLNALNTPMQPLQQEQVGRLGVVSCFHLPALAPFVLVIFCSTFSNF